MAFVLGTVLYLRILFYHARPDDRHLKLNSSKAAIKNKTTKVHIYTNDNNDIQLPD